MTKRTNAVARRAGLIDLGKITTQTKGDIQPVALDSSGGQFKDQPSLKAD